MKIKHKVKSTSNVIQIVRPTKIRKQRNALFLIVLIEFIIILLIINK